MTRRWGDALDRALCGVLLADIKNYWTSEYAHQLDAALGELDAATAEIARLSSARPSWREIARRVPASGPLRRIEDRIADRRWSSEIWHPAPMHPRVVSAIESGFRAWCAGRRGDPETMAALESFVSRWDSGREGRDAELAFDVAVLAVAIEPEAPNATPAAPAADDASPKVRLFDAALDRALCDRLIREVVDADEGSAGVDDRTWDLAGQLEAALAILDPSAAIGAPPVDAAGDPAAAAPAGPRDENRGSTQSDMIAPLEATHGEPSAIYSCQETIGTPIEQLSRSSSSEPGDPGCAEAATGWTRRGQDPAPAPSNLFVVPVIANPSSPQDEATRPAQSRLDSEFGRSRVTAALRLLGMGDCSPHQISRYCRADEDRYRRVSRRELRETERLLDALAAAGLARVVERVESERDEWPPWNRWSITPRGVARLSGTATDPDEKGE